MYLELNPDLTPAQIALKEQMHRFAAEVTRPASIALDKLENPEEVARSPILRDVFRQNYELQYNLAGFPEDLGGTDVGGIEAHIIIEEAGWGAADLAISLMASTFPYLISLKAFQLTGNQRLMDDIVLPYTQDREGKTIGCWAVTEAQHGSDSLAVNLPEFGGDSSVSLDTWGKPDGDDWIINGSKAAWVSNGTIATHALLHFSIDRSKGPTNAAIAVMPLNLPGVSRGKPLNKMGQRALNQGEIFFDNVRIPGYYVITPPDVYPLAVDFILANANAGMSCTFTGLARAAFEEAMTYCKQRVQGAKCLCEHQLVQRKLFDMFIKVESARQLSRAVLQYNLVAQPPVPRYSIAAKVYCTQAAFEVANDAVQLFGGYGLSREFLVEKLFRDARSSLIEDGSNDVLALAACRSLIDSHIV